jgi:hypothetical protein
VPDGDDDDDNNNNNNNNNNVTHENITADGVTRNVQIAGVGTSSVSLIHQASRPTAVSVTSKKTTCTLQCDTSFVNRSLEYKRPNSPSVPSTRPTE